MNINKGFSILSVLISFITFNSCINEPKFSIVPQIGLLDRYVIVTQDPNLADTLFVVLSFKDGDGDLGFPTDDPRYTSTPYNESFFFVKSDNDTTLTAIGTSEISVKSNEKITVFDFPTGASGKLVTLQTRDIPGMENILPPYEVPYSVTSYNDGTFYVRKSDAGFLGDLKPVKTVKVPVPDGDSAVFYGVLATFFMKSNDNHYNIDVIFEVRNNDTYVPFDWGKTARWTSPSRGRFPNLGDAANPSSPIEGTLKYGIADPDLLYYFKNQAVRLKIQIKDRALHKSNIVTTAEFTLDGIRRN